MSRPYYSDLIANSTSGCLFDFTVPWNRRAVAIGRIAINGVAATLAIELASMTFQMTD